MNAQCIRVLIEFRSVECYFRSFVISIPMCVPVVILVNATMNRVVKLVLAASVILSCMYYLTISSVSLSGEEYRQESPRDPRIDPRKMLDSVTESSSQTKAKMNMEQLVRLMQNGSWPVSYIKQLSNREVTDVARLFNVPGLSPNCGPLQRQFLQFPARHIINDHLYVKGRGVIIKHFQTCKQMSFKKQNDVVGLVSFPGSGNSWVRQLLETSTGVYTGSIYNDKSYVTAGMIGEGIKSKCVIAVKSHHCNNLKTFSKMIYVVRNPFDAILAEFTRLKKKHANASTSHVAGLDNSYFGKFMYT